MTLAFALCGLLATYSAFAAAPGAAGGVHLPPGAGNLSAFMITAAGLDNAEYINCIKSRIKAPPEVNVVYNAQVAAACQTQKN